MGKHRKRFNWKARQAIETTIDKSEQQKIKVELSSNTTYDEANALVLPSKKRKTKLKKPDQKVTKLLSKNQRKRLEKIVDKKKKKENRAALIESLAKFQVTNDELNKYTSFTQAQTKGLKRKYNHQENDWSDKLNIEILQNSTSINSAESLQLKSVKGSRKRMRLLAAMFPIKKKEKNPNFVGLEESSSEEISSCEESVDVNVNDGNIEVDKKLVEHAENSKKNSQSCLTKNTSSKYKIGENPTYMTTNDKKDNRNFEENNKTVKPIEREPATFVPVERDATIQEARLKLPILAEEQIIMETINANPIVLLVGETGSGKTTQVPQFLYEAGYARDKMIGITEPRRVAAISMAKRVGEELNLGSDKVSYLIRFEGNVTPETKIKFMTDGVLLKEIQSDFLLTKYSVIILDEAHERSVYTDILMGLLSRIVPLRNKRHNSLKLIIMSATLRVEDFTQNLHLFKTPPPVIKVESRQFPVSIHFNKRTNPDYVKEAFKKVCRIHTQLPDGGILVFLTGQQEVNRVVSKLRDAFPLKNRPVFIKENTKEKLTNVGNEVSDDEVELDLAQTIKKAKKINKRIKLPEINLDSFDVAPNDDTEHDLMEEMDPEEGDWEEDSLLFKNAQPMWVLPLYSLLPSYKQAKVFKPPPEGCRLCIVATNVAETSLTIPGVKYVVDSGKVKTKLYDKVTGVTAFSIVWTSKSGANQRAGRAGRTGPGHCYRLYSSAVFNDQFEEWAVPEIKRRPVDELVLQMKSLGIERVVNFPFPSPPDHVQLKDAEHRLILLGALDKSHEKDGKDFCGKITALGNSMARFPVAPRFAKMLCLSHQHNLLEYTVAVVAAMSVQEIILNNNEKGWKISRTKWKGPSGHSLLLGDAMVLLKVVGAAEFANSTGKLNEFCSFNHIRQKGIVEVRKIRSQLTNEINLLNPDVNLFVNPKMQPPDETQGRLLRQIMLSGFIDQVARKCTETENKDLKKKPMYNTSEMEESVQMHGSSALCKEYPDWVVYQEIYETNKMYLRGITAIEPEWLPLFAPSLCHLGEPLDDPPPFYDDATGLIRCHVKGTFGRRGWELPVVEIEHPQGLNKFKLFAIFFLEGRICKQLKKYKNKLLSSPQIMSKTWSKFQPRTETLLKSLASEGVDSKERLLSVWNTKTNFLLSAYQNWLPESLHNEVAMKWPPNL